MKNANAKQTGLKNGFISLHDVAADKGTDLETLFAQHQQTKSLPEQYEIKMAFEPFGTPHQSVIPDSETDVIVENELG